MNIDFDPKSVAEEISKAILNSTFNEVFTNAVKTEIERITKADYNQHSVVGEIVKRYINDTARLILDSEYKEKISNMIREKFKNEKFDELCQQLVEKVEVRESRY